MNNGESEGSAAIRAAIARHLQLHPLACDSVEGIHAWWLVPAGVIAMDISVEAVVERMTAEGLLRRVQLPDGKRLYGAAIGSEG